MGFLRNIYLITLYLLQDYAASYEKQLTCVTTDKGRCSHGPS